MINLGIGSPDLPPHPEVVNTLCEFAQRPDTHAYQSYRGIPALRTAIASWYQQAYQVTLDPEREILPLMGSKEGILHICMTYLQDGDEALIPNPGYPTYRSAVQLSGAACREYALTEANHWLPDLKELGKSDLGRVKLMWVNYPHMPTGTQATVTFFEELLAFAREHELIICHDNPYSFILNETPLSLLAAEGAKEVALELNSLSKSCNMAGWRVGMLAGKAERINDILRFKSNMDSGMFMPVQMAAVKALELGRDWYDALNARYASRREKAFNLLQQLNCTYNRTQAGMFVWAKIPDSYRDGYELSDQILQKSRVFITPGGIFGSNGDQYIRISLCADENTFEQAINRVTKL